MLVDVQNLVKSCQNGGVRGRFVADADLGKLTWFRCGGKVPLMFQPQDEADLTLFLRLVPLDVPIYVVGIGSNLLIRDGGIDGVVIRLSQKGFGTIEHVAENRLEAGAAASDKSIAAAALEAGLGGFHFLHGIPGGLGGALRMNAGANGIEMAERVHQVRALDRQGRVHLLSQADMNFSYRSSRADNGLIFISSLLEGTPAPHDEIVAATRGVQHHRESVQPVREKTGGSTFRNPPGYTAWEVIDAAGCRGLTIGGAQMSPLHCNFMINTGNATAHDLELLGETVRARVLNHSGIDLHWEIKRIGHLAAGQSL